CKNTSAIQIAAKTIGDSITFGSLNTLGLFFSIIYGIYIIIAIFNNSEACKFIKPKLSQLFEPLILLPTNNVASSNKIMTIIIHFCNKIVSKNLTYIQMAIKT